ncbi:MAG: MarR family winged helix-turn-helix transcriptional regulator [Pseudomonadota bacterium]
MKFDTNTTGPFGGHDGLPRHGGIDSGMTAPISALGIADGEAEQALSVGAYVEMLGVVERLHRELIDLVKCALEAAGRSDPSPVQALMLFHLSEREMTASELGSRGLYQGSNVSYNLRKLVDGGYVEHRRCEIDGRAVRLRPTETGREVQAILTALFKNQAQALEHAANVRGLDGGLLLPTLRLMREARRDAAPLPM